MGTIKAVLPFGNEVMLARVVRLLSGAVEPVIVVAAAGQPLPELPQGVRIVHDRRPGRGPLEGLFAGLTALGDTVSAAYVTGCDTPLLHPDFVRRLLELSEGYDIAVPREGKFFHPLAAVYRPGVTAAIDELLRRDIRRPVALYEQVRTRAVDVDRLRDVDPELHSLLNVNSPDQYHEALRIAGLPAPPD